MWLHPGETTRKFGNDLPGLSMDKVPRDFCCNLVFSESQQTERDMAKCIINGMWKEGEKCMFLRMQSCGFHQYKQNTGQGDTVQSELILTACSVCFSFLS